MVIGEDRVPYYEYYYYSFLKFTQHFVGELLDWNATHSPGHPGTSDIQEPVPDLLHIIWV